MDGPSPHHSHPPPSPQEGSDFTHRPLQEVAKDTGRNHRRPNHSGLHVGGTLSTQVQRETVDQWTKEDQELADDRQSSGGGWRWLFNHVNVLEVAELVFLEEGSRGGWACTSLLLARGCPPGFPATHSAVSCVLSPLLLAAVRQLSLAPAHPSLRLHSPHPSSLRPARSSVSHGDTGHLSQPTHSSLATCCHLCPPAGLPKPLLNHPPRLETHWRVRWTGALRTRWHHPSQSSCPHPHLSAPRHMGS